MDGEVPSSRGRLSNGAWTSKAGKAALSAADRSDARTTRQEGHQGLLAFEHHGTAAALQEASVAGELDRVAQPLCSAYNRIFLPASGEPSQAGCANVGRTNSFLRQRHSYSGQPCSKSPCKSRSSRQVPVRLHDIRAAGAGPADSWPAPRTGLSGHRGQCPGCCGPRHSPGSVQGAGQAPPRSALPAGHSQVIVGLGIVGFSSGRW